MDAWFTAIAIKFNRGIYLMSIKHRVRALELEHKVNMGKEPWLLFDIDGEPTTEQQKSMDEAERMGKEYICFIPKEILSILVV